MKRASKGYTGVDTPLFQTMLVQGQTLQGEGSTIPVKSHHTPISAPYTSQPPTSSPFMPITHVAEEAAPMPHESPLLRVYSLGSDGGSLTLNELIVLCTLLSKKVASLESDLKQTKQIYGAAYTKLIIKVKKLEHKGRKIAQIDEDKGITLVQIVTTADEGVSTARATPEGVSTAKSIPEAISTAEPYMDVTLAEALVDLLKSGKNKSPKPKARDDKDKDSEKKARGIRKKTLSRKRASEKQSEENAKRQKMEDDAEKEELRSDLDIIPGDDVAVSVESLATKYPIVDWNKLVLLKKRWDRGHLGAWLDLYRLVKERFETASPEGYEHSL
ncbi:hypothetical protein Tco_0889465 [Tanacetum coccineum]